MEANSGPQINPSNNLVCPLLTDMYQISMSYAYWKGGRSNDDAVFDLFFRKCPFKGEYCVFAGLDEVMKLVTSFKFSTSDIDYLKTIIPHAEPEFFEYLLQLDCSKTRIYAIREGTIVFPREPLLRIEGPLVVGQLLETPLLNLINFPSLLTTNAARMRRVVGDNKTLMEFGLRRAQGPDGALSASRYAMIGGFNATSNVLAGKLFDVPVRGTHAHAYVMAHKSMKELHSKLIRTCTGEEVDFISLVIEKSCLVQEALELVGVPRESELAAFVSYAQAFPSSFLALVDTFDTLRSGVPNYLSVGLALHSLGYKPVGIRLDSGDLGVLSTAARELFKRCDALIGVSVFEKTIITASDDINEKRLLDLATQGHEIDSFGIGTNLVTCQAQPALGCVYKLVEINKEPRIKLSNDSGKVVTPGSKVVYRMYDEMGCPIGDVLKCVEEPPLLPDVPLDLRLFSKTGIIVEHQVARRVELLMYLAWDAGAGAVEGYPCLSESTSRCKDQMTQMIPHTDPLSPVPYKVYMSVLLHEMMLALQKE